MKNMFKTMAVLALASSVSFAGDTTAPADAKAAKDIEKKIADQGIYVETAKPGVTLSGYVDAGYSLNAEGPTATTADAARFGDDSQARGGFNLNAFKLALEKPLGDKNEFAAGFRTDLMFGTDAAVLSGTSPNINNGKGSTSTGISSGTDTFVEQAFVQFRAPVGNGIDFHVGRFVTPMGYEVIERPANPNITYGNLFVNMIPLFHQGAEATYKINDTFSVLGAVVNGWNDSRPTVQGNNNGGIGVSTTNNPNNYGLIGQLTANSAGGNASIVQTVYYGVEGDSGVLANVGTGATNNDGLFVYDVVGNWKPTFVKDSALNLGYNVDYGRADYDTAANASKTDQWYGVALYSQYQLTKLVGLNGRADWIHDTNGAKFGDQAAGAAAGTFIGPVGTTANPTIGKSIDIYSYTLTSTFNVWDNMQLRGEYRIDWGNDWGISATNGTTTSKWGASHLFTAEVVYSF